MTGALQQAKGRMPGYVIYSFLWIFFLIIPVITNNYGTKGDFERILYDWLRMLPFFIVFVVNSVWLLPKILFRKSTKLYLVMLIIIVTIVTILFQVIGPELYKNDPKLLERRILQDPQWGREDMIPGNGQAPSGAEIFNPAPGNTRQYRMPVDQQPLYRFINTFFISLLLAGFNTSIAMTNKWVDEEEARRESEKEHIRSELAFLQNQVSPHFFMNTLNNIHALVEADQKLAQNAILRLSELMRYLLYESGRGTTTLKKEAEFLKSYVRLMQLRVDDRVKVNIELPREMNNVDLPPLLFISFIENAFKHGVSYREPSSMSFRLIQNPGSIEFISENTIPSLPSTQSSKNHSGIGLENIRKRLDLLYGNDYQLSIDKTEHKFKVKLVIPA
jgi:hypothetical protein